MESSAFPDELVREIAVLTPYPGPEMAPHLGAFWECCWVHGIDPRNPGHANDIAPEILEEREHFGSVEPEPARTPLPNGNDQAAVAAIDCGGHQASSRPAWHHPPGPPVRVLECRRPAGLAFRASSAPRNAKPNCATLSGKRPQNDQLWPGTIPKSCSISVSLTNQRTGRRAS